MSERKVSPRLGIFVYDANKGVNQPIISKVLELVTKHYRLEREIEQSDIAIAPLLQRMLSREEIITPRLGTLVFHPSLLPRHRGMDAIKWAFRLREAYTGVTWFWPDEGIDTGPICEQEVVAILPEERPRDFYSRAVIPAAMRTLDRALAGISGGNPRKVPQQHEHGTIEPRIHRQLPKGGCP